MYHFPNPEFGHSHKDQHCSFFSSTSEDTNNQLTNQPGVVASLAPVSFEAQVANVSGSRAGLKKAAKGAKLASGPGRGRGRGRAVTVRVVDTSQFTVEQRVVAAVWVHERLHARTSMGQIKQQFLARFGRAAPARNTLLGWERKLFASGAVHDAPRAGRPARRKLLAGAVRASLAAAPALSLRARAAALAVPRSTLRALLRRDRRQCRDCRECRASPPPAGV